MTWLKIISYLNDLNCLINLSDLDHPRTRDRSLETCTGATCKRLQRWKASFLFHVLTIRDWVCSWYVTSDCSSVKNWRTERDWWSLDTRPASTVARFCQWVLKCVFWFLKFCIYIISGRTLISNLASKLNSFRHQLKKNTQPLQLLL